MARFLITKVIVIVAIIAVALAILLWIGVVRGVGWLVAWASCTAFAVGGQVEYAIQAAEIERMLAERDDDTE